MGAGSGTASGNHRPSGPLRDKFFDNTLTGWVSYGQPDLVFVDEDAGVSIRGLTFVGVRTERFADVCALYRDVLGLAMIKDEPQAAWFVTPTGDEVHVYGPDDHDHDFFLQGPVVGLQVEDFAATRTAMVAAGIRFIGEPQTSGGAVWHHYYGPDGNVYEIMQRPGGA